MARWAGVLLVVGAAMLAPSDAAAASCASRGSQTMAENEVARLFRDSRDDYLACSKRTGNVVLLAGDPEEWVTTWKLSGHFAAYYWRACEPGDFPCYNDFRLLDVRRRNPISIGDYEPHVIVMRPNGSVAWSEAGHDDEDTGGYVYRYTLRGKTRLDRGPDVDPASLRLRGRKLSWVNGGRLRRATLR